MMLIDEQKEIVTASRISRKLVVNALAGTGKTSTAIACVAAQKRDAKIAYLCFNRTNAEEMRSRFQASGIDAKVDSTTLHALAYRHVALPLVRSGRRIGDLKPYDIEKIMKFENENGDTINDRNVHRRLCRLLLDALGLWCHSRHKSFQEFQIAGLPRQMKQQIREFGASEDQFHALIQILWVCITEDQGFPLTHDAYLKLFHLQMEHLRNRLPYDLVIVDEAQDLFPVTEAIVDTMSHFGSRIICLGDRYQQIYGWNLSVNAMDNFEQGADILELSQSFRCPENVVREAVPWLRLLGFRGTFRPAETEKIIQDCPLAFLSRSNSGLLLALDDILVKGLAPLRRIHPLGGVDKYSFQAIQDRIAFMENRKNDIKSPVMRGLASEEEYDAYALATLDQEMSLAKKIVSKIGIARIKVLLDCFRMGLFAPSRKDADICISTGHRSKGSEFETCIIVDSYPNVYQEYLAHQEKCRKQKKKKLQGTWGQLIPELSKKPGARALSSGNRLQNLDMQSLVDSDDDPFFLNAEELRIAYVSLTRATKKVFPGPLRLTDTYAVITSLVRDSMILLVDRNDRGDFINFVPRDTRPNRSCNASAQPQTVSAVEPIRSVQNLYNWPKLLERGQKQFFREKVYS